MATASRRILFACNMNSIRSPMAEALARQILGPNAEIVSCGVYEGILDPFVPQILAEIGAEVPSRGPQTFRDIDLSKFDRVIALTPEAAAEARRGGARPEFWETPNPTDVRGTEEELIGAYRDCRDRLAEKVRSELLD